MKTLQDVQTWRGRTALDGNGEKIGTIEDIYLDRQSGEPEWATVKTGLFGMKQTFVPIGDAESTADGVRVPFTKDQVNDAPRIDADGELSADEERRLYEHYGRSDYEWSGEDRTAVGRDVSGPTTDDAMTRSEEEMRVGTERRESGRARLRKYVVTEQVQRTVPVQHEEVRIEREPITEGNVEQALAGPEISEEEHEVVLHEEEPVVEKRTVPKERVRMEKETVTEEQTVGGEVRKERIEPDVPGDQR